MKQATILRSRRTLLRKSSLGMAGALGAASAASFISLQGDSSGSIAHAADANPLVGVWNFTANLQVPSSPLPSVPGFSELPTSDLPLPSVVHGQILFWSQGAIGIVSDADGLPLLGGPMALGTWSMPVSGQFAFHVQRYVFPAFGKGVLSVQGAGTLDASGNFNASGTLTSPSIPVPVAYTLVAQRFENAVS
jgi:hypothetical protein